MHMRRIAHLITLYVKINTDPKAVSVNTFSYIAIIVQPEPLNVQHWKQKLNKHEKRGKKAWICASKNNLITLGKQELFISTRLQVQINM